MSTNSSVGSSVESSVSHIATSTPTAATTSTTSTSTSTSTTPASSASSLPDWSVAETSCKTSSSQLKRLLRVLKDEQVIIDSFTQTALSKLQDKLQADLLRQQQLKKNNSTKLTTTSTTAAPPLSPAASFSAFAIELEAQRQKLLHSFFSYASAAAQQCVAFDRALALLTSITFSHSHSYSDSYSYSTTHATTTATSLPLQIHARLSIRIDQYRHSLSSYTENLTNFQNWAEQQIEYNLTSPRALEFITQARQQESHKNNQSQNNYPTFPSNQTSLLSAQSSATSSSSSSSQSYGSLDSSTSSFSSASSPPASSPLSPHHRPISIPLYPISPSSATTTATSSSTSSFSTPPKMHSSSTTISRDDEQLIDRLKANLGVMHQQHSHALAMDSDESDMDDHHLNRIAPPNTNSYTSSTSSSLSSSSASASNGPAPLPMNPLFNKQESQRARLFDSRESIRSVDSSLDRTSRALAETVEVGAETASLLLSQREIFLKQKNSLQETDNFVTLSKKTLSRMHRRIISSKIIQCLIILLEIALIILIVYFKYFNQ